MARDAHTQTVYENMVYISNDKVKLKADPNTMKWVVNKYVPLFSFGFTEDLGSVLIMK